MKPDDTPLGMARLVRNYSTYSAILAGVIAVWSWAGWGWPLVKAQDYEKDRAADKAEVKHQFEQIGGRVERLENAVTSLTTTVLEGQEMQLRISLQDKSLPPADRIRGEQQLRKVQAEIARRYGSSPNHN